MQVIIVLVEHSDFGLDSDKGIVINSLTKSVTSALICERIDIMKYHLGV